MCIIIYHKLRVFWKFWTENFNTLPSTKYVGKDRLLAGLESGLNSTTCLFSLFMFVFALISGLCLILSV